MSGGDWLLKHVCELAAELTDELERLPADRIEVELRVSGWAANGQTGPADFAEYIRRTRSNGGEWGGTERISRERFV